MSSGAAPSAAYKNVVRGKLQLKGAKKAPAAAGSSSSGSKRKPPEPTDAERIAAEDRELERLLALKKENDAKAAETAAAASAATTELDDEAAAKQAQIDDLDLDSTLTKAQRDFQRAQAERELELIKKKIAKTHRQRVEEYNAYLGSLTEHNDIPRVGPG